MMTNPRQPTDRLLKQNLADLLRAEIIGGTLQPGERIVEARWASHFGAAQASVREAINILAQEGFVTKQSGRSARVVDLSERDVIQLYQIRGAVEGLAARLAVHAGPDLSKLQSAVDGMRAAAVSGDREGLLDCDLQFHLHLCEAAGNPFLLEHARRILLPFFAFLRMRIAARHTDASVWSKHLEAHQTIVDLLQEGEGGIAELYLIKSMDRFAQTVQDNWDNGICDDQ